MTTALTIALTLAMLAPLVRVAGAKREASFMFALAAGMATGQLLIWAWEAFV